jgi:hypothetical protein
MEKQLQNVNAITLGTKNLTARVITSTVRRPIVLMAAAALIIGAGLYLNWPTLVGLSLAPLILTVAPCALICAFGLCAMSGNKNKVEGKPPSPDDQE